MRCWRCNDRDEADEFGLCKQCDDELRRENLIPPGRQLHATGTLPEDIKGYIPPPASAYRTVPQWAPEAECVITQDDPISDRPINYETYVNWYSQVRALIEDPAITSVVVVAPRRHGRSTFLLDL